MSAARAAAQASQAAESDVLPLPGPVVQHHLEALSGTMTQWRDQARVPPVLLLTGPSGVGKRSMGHYLAQWLLCEKSGFRKADEDAGPSLFGDAPTPVASPGAPVPCGECASCARALKGAWVDFQEIQAEPGERDAGTLKIDQFRALKATQGFGAFQGAFRIILIRDAERMTAQAANSLLKILEEPPPGWIFILTAADPCLLMPTLVSRCQIFRLKPFSESVLRELLLAAGVPAPRASSCAQLAQGSWGRALSLARDEAWENREAVLRFLENPDLEAGKLIDWAATEHENFQLLLTQLEQATAELLNWSVAQERILPHPSLKAHALAAVKKLGSPASARSFWLARAERLFRAREESLAPINRKILLQDLLLPWIESR